MRAAPWTSTSSRFESSRSATIGTSTRCSARSAPIATLAGIDRRSHALLRIAALIAMDAAPPSFMSAVEAGLDAGASRDEIVGTLIAVLPIVGAARVVSFPPIADYAFLSNCHTGALVASDGAVEWLCIPSFDSPSVFGSLLDRGAGLFRLRAVRHQPSDRAAYEPGTNVLVTTWKTPTGWIVVRDALTIGPWDHEDTVTPHTRPPADDDADHMLVRTVECLEGTVEVELVCEPVFDYGRTPAEWTLVDGGRHTADATGAGVTFRLQTDMRARDRGRPRPGAARAQPGERLLRALVGRGPRFARRRRGGRAAPRRDGSFLAPLAGPGADSGPPVARPDPALGARDQGPDLHADRRDRGRADDLAARDPGRRAQLGLPLHVDARLDLHAPGAALPEPRLGGRRVHPVRGRRRRPTTTARCRSCTGSTVVGT